MSRRIIISPLTPESFAPFGDVIEAVGSPTTTINQGKCGRYNDLAKLDFAADEGGKVAISVFEGTHYDLPLELEMVERHPLGSQAFLPLSSTPFLVVVAPDDKGVPGIPQAFLTRPGQGVNYWRNVWHGVLTPLLQTSYFAVVDRVGSGNNLEEHWFYTPYTIVGD